VGIGASKGVGALFSNQLPSGVITCRSLDVCRLNACLLARLGEELPPRIIVLLVPFEALRFYGIPCPSGVAGEITAAFREDFLLWSASHFVLES